MCKKADIPSITTRIEIVNMAQIANVRNIYKIPRYVVFESPILNIIFHSITESSKNKHKIKNVVKIKTFYASVVKRSGSIVLVPVELFSIKLY